MIKQNPAFVLRNVENEHILVSCRKTNQKKWMFYLNSTAVYIWKLIGKQGMEKGKVMETIKCNYDIQNNSSQCNVINKFINQLIEREILIEEKDNDK